MSSVGVLSSDTSRFNPRQATSYWTSRGYGVRYPSPFFDVAQQFLPENVHQLHLWCRYYFLTNPIINVACQKMAAYPVTPIVWEAQDADLVKLYTDLEGLLRLRQAQVEIGLDYYTYGNAFGSVFFQLEKYLVCPHCKERFRASKSRSYYKWRSGRFFLTCPRCKNEGFADQADSYPRNIRGARLVRWNPENIEIKYNEITGTSRYYFRLPRAVLNDVRLGDPDAIETLPFQFLEAARAGRALLFHPDNFFHLKRPTIAQKDQGWGTPLIYPLLKDAFYLQVMKKAQECVAPDTLIETSAGLRPASDVQVGDYVRSHVGQFKRVFDRWSRPINTLQGEHAVKITLSGLREHPSTFSPNHPMLTVRRNQVWRRKDMKEAQRSSGILKNPHLWDMEFVEAGELREGQYIAYPTVRPTTSSPRVDLTRYTSFTATDAFVYSGCSQETAEAFEHVEQGEAVPVALHGTNALKVARRVLRAEKALLCAPRVREITKDLAYVAGWAAGGGSPGTRRYDFSVGTDDPLDDLQQALVREFGKGASVYDQRPQSEMFATSFCGTINATFLAQWVGRGSHNKRIPDEILEAPDDVLCTFLRGLWEAAGHFSGPRTTLTTVSRELAYRTRTALISLGCITTVSKKDGSKYPKKIGEQVIHSDLYYTVDVCNKSKDRLRALLYGGVPPVVVSGKGGFFFKGYFLSKILSVEQDPCPEVINFSVEGDHTFCTFGMATHNSLLLEHVVPLRILFPGPTTGGNDGPFGAYNLVNWKQKVDVELSMWKRDHNYIPILPMNLGYQQIGGQAKALILHQEFRIHAEQMLAGAGIPVEFVYGGLQWSSSNTSLRALENEFLGYNIERYNFVRFIVDKVAAHMGWPKVPFRFERFRMADDLQRAMFFFQLNQAQKISDRRMLEEIGEDFDTENTRLAEEMQKQISVQRKMQLATADTQGAGLVRTAFYQARANEIAMRAQAAAQADMQAEGPMPAPVPPGDPAAAAGQPAPEQAQQPGAPETAGAAPTATPQDPTQQVAGMPEGATAYQENSAAPNASAAPTAMASMQSQIQPGMGGLDLRYMAQRAASYLKTVGAQQGDQAMYQELGKMQVENPQLYRLVVQLMNDSGSRTDPTNPTKAPITPRSGSQRDAARAVGG